MNIKYLNDYIIPQREEEVNLGYNFATNNPIYIVFDLIERITSEHSDYDLTCNYADKPMTFGYIDTALDEPVFSESNFEMESPEEVTKFYTDRVVSIFLTYKSAREYLEYQKHNMENPYIYCFNAGYRNIEADNLFNKKA